MTIRRYRWQSCHSTLPLLLAIALAGCERPAEQPPEGGPPPTEATATGSDALLLASAKVALPPELDVEALPEPQSPGALQLQTHCTACHSLPSPAMHSAMDWPVVARRMWLRMELLDPQLQVPVPTAGDRAVILDYLRAHAFEVSRGTLPEAPGRDLFEAACNQCHDLPDPRQHSPEDWLTVVRRMNQNMRDILGTELTPTETERIIGYLEVASTER